MGPTEGSSLTSGATTRSEHYRADIDGLRAVAVLAVVAFHAFPAAAPGGFVGVDVFFVISGFLISGLILGDLARGRFRFATFYARRIRRIFPALLAMMAALLAFGWIALVPDEYRQLSRHVVGAAGFALNFLLWGESGYFDTAARLKPLLHLWSLAIEEQFYIVWPLVLVAASRWRLRLSWLLAAGIALSFGANLRAVATQPQSAFYLPLPRFWELLLGALLAHAAAQGRAQLPRRWANGAAASGALLLALAIGVIDERRAFPGAWALLPTIGAALLIWAGPDAWLNRALLARRSCVAVGLISYPLYLWHWPLLSLAAMIELGQVRPETTLALVALSFALAALTYQLIEKPIRFGTRSAGARGMGRRELALATTMALVATFAFWVDGQNGVKRRFARELARPPAAQLTDANCERFLGLAQRHFEYCRLAQADGERVTAVIGDSHAAALFRGISELLAQRGVATLLLATPGCPPLVGTTFGRTESDRAGCSEKSQQILSAVGGKPQIRSVILTLRGPLWVTGEGFGEVDRHPWATPAESEGPGPSEASGLPALVGGLRRTIERLESEGKDVTLVLDVPELGFDPRACMERPRWLRPSHACEVDRGEVDARQTRFRTAVFALARGLPGLRVVDPLPLLCDGERCRANDGEVLLYDDDDHLSSAGSRLVAARVLETLGPEAY